jgi:uncharacterized protein with PQ loop repeat
MTTQIEVFYQLRKKYRGAHVLGLSIFFFAWIARSIYKISTSNMENVHLIIFILLLLSLAYLAYFAIRFNIIERKIKQDPSLREALHDELFQLNELRAWRTAFFSVISFNLIVALLSLFIVFEDFMLIFITTLLIGFGSYSLTLYILDR